MELEATIQAIYPLAVSEATRIIKITEEVPTDKGQLIIEADRTSRFIYLIQSGIYRIFYPKSGREIILDFSFPGDTLISLNSYIHGKPGYESIDCIEAGNLYRISIGKLVSLYEDSVRIANWGRKLAENETLKIEERLMQQLFKTATERYAYLLNKDRKLLHQIKLGYIASYLGVSQVTLSRIRAELK